MKALDLNAPNDLLQGAGNFVDFQFLAEVYRQCNGK